MDDGTVPLRAPRVNGGYCDTALGADRCSDDRFAARERNAGESALIGP
jgi:hypothetical protein